MDKKQEEQVIESLVDFIARVAKGETTSETEIDALPKVVELLLNYHCSKNLM